MKQLRAAVPSYHADSKFSKASYVIFKILFLVKTYLQLFLTHHLIQFLIKSLLNCIDGPRKTKCDVN